MSYPTLGFPDYSRLSPEGGRVLGTLSGVVSTNPATNPISSTGFGYITLMTKPSPPGCNYYVILNWGFNTDSAVRYADTQYVPDSANFNAVNFPVIGEWFTVEYLYLSGTNTISVETLIYGTNAPQILPPLGCSGQGYLQEYVLINSGTTQTFAVPGCHQGRAKLCVAGAANADWFVFVNQWNPNTPGWQETYLMLGSTMGQAGVIEIALAPAPTQLAVTNTPGANQDFLVTLIPI
jgi:hypothetical protein